MCTRVYVRARVAGEGMAGSAAASEGSEHTHTHTRIPSRRKLHFLGSQLLHLEDGCRQLQHQIQRFVKTSGAQR